MNIGKQFQYFMEDLISRVIIISTYALKSSVVSFVCDSQHLCGRRHIKPIEPKVISRVVAGYEVYPPHSQPWIVAFANISRKFASCGGTLIHPKFVISAMHCFDSLSSVVLRSIAVLGLHDKANLEEDLQ